MERERQRVTEGQREREICAALVGRGWGNFDLNKVLSIANDYTAAGRLKHSVEGKMFHYFFFGVLFMIYVLL